MDDSILSDIQDFHELLRTRDQEGLISALDNPELLRISCDDERYLQLAMQAIGVLAWSAPAQASDFLVRYDVNRSREDPESPARRAARSILAALEWQQLETNELLPLSSMSTLRDFLILQPALGDQGEHAQAMYRDLQDRPAFYATFFYKLAELAQVLPRCIFQMAAEPETPEAPLSESQENALSRAIAELRVSLKSPYGRYVLLVVLCGLLVASPNALGALGAIVAVAVYMSVGERNSYETVVRPRLAALAIEHGVGASDVVSRLYRLNRKAGRVGGFDIKIENDHALNLLAALSRSLHPEH